MIENMFENHSQDSKNKNSTLIHFNSYYNLFIIKLNLLTKLDIYYMENDKSVHGGERVFLKQAFLACRRDKLSIQLTT